MQRNRQKLTQKLVDGLVCPDGKESERVPDSELVGFGVRVFQSGTKKFYVTYRDETQRKRQLNIGTLGPLTVEAARRKAKIELGKVAHGENPQVDKVTQRKGLTIAGLAQRYVTAMDNKLILNRRGEPKKASTIALDKGRIKRHINPLLGHRLVTELGRSDCAKFVRDIISGKTATVERTGPRGKAVVTGGPTAAKRCAGLLSSMLNYAIDEDIIDANPMHGVKLPADKVKDRRFERWEMERIGATLFEMQEEHMTWQAIAATWLLALTGCRASEIETLKWSALDKERQLMVLEETKEGKSGRPVGSLLWGILDRLPSINEQYVLPGVKNGKHYGGYKHASERMFKRAGIERATRHTWRHNFKSIGNDLGYTESTLDALVGHKARAKYIHSRDDVLIAAVDKVTAAVLEQMGGKLPTQF